MRCDGTQPLVLLPAAAFRVSPVKAQCKQNADSNSFADQESVSSESGVQK